MPSFATLTNRCGGKPLIRLLALLLALAVAPPMLLAQEWDHLNRRDRLHDPTGTWLLKTSIRAPLETSPRLFVLIAFHHGGTVTQDIQGESAFDPSAVNLPLSDPRSVFNIITSPAKGVWQKTGWNTFAATLLSMEYHVSTNPEPSSPLFRFDVLQYAGKINASGDQITLSALLTFFDAEGNQLDPKKGIPINATGVPVPLTVLPQTLNHLPIPPDPSEPAP